MMLLLLFLTENITHNRLPKLDSYSIQLDKMSQEALWLEQTVESIKSQLSSTSEGGEAAASDYMKGKLFAFNVVLCHNDVLSGNVLLHHSDSDSTSSSSSTAPPNNENETIFHKIPQTNDNVVEAADPHITLIDYEYSCYSYRAFDIANHFCGEFLPFISSPSPYSSLNDCLNDCFCCQFDCRICWIFI